MLLLPGAAWWSKVMFVQSLLIAGVSLRASFLLRPHGVSLSVGAVQLRYVLLLHGLFYFAKAASIVALDTFVDLAAFRGEVIQISLVEGAMAIMLIALSMTGTERHRREERIEQLAARDPLTALYNRRALDQRARRAAGTGHAAQPRRPAADRYRQLQAGQRPARPQRRRQIAGGAQRNDLQYLPQGALAARLGGDEFVILLRDASSDSVVTLGNALRGMFAQMAQQAFATPKAVTLSMGATLFERPPASLSALLELGDAALYSSKREGRDSVRVVRAA